MSIKKLHETYVKRLKAWRFGGVDGSWLMVKSARTEYRKLARAIFMRVSDRMGIAYAHVEEDPINDIWRYHIFVDHDMPSIGRSAGDTLCRTREEFTRFNENEERQSIPDCPKCLEIAEKLDGGK